MACFGVAKFVNTCKVDVNTGEALLNLNGGDGSVAYSSLHRERNLETYCNHDPSHYYLHFPCATNDLRILSFNIIFFNTFPAFFLTELYVVVLFFFITSTLTTLLLGINVKRCIVC